jgi:hypothetical protein
MAKGTTVTLLAVSTAIAIGAALYLVQANAPETELERSPLYPGLTEQANDIAEIVIADRSHLTTLARAGEGWVVRNRDDYPAMFEPVKQLVVAAAGLRILEAKTSNAELYPRLGVEAVDAADSHSRSVVFSTADGKALVNFIVGNVRETQEGGLTTLKGLYVRQQGDDQALLVEGELNAPVKPADWMQRELFNIPGERIRELRLETGGTTTEISRERQSESDFQLVNIPPGNRLRSQSTLNSLATALAELRFDDVAAASRIAITAPTATATLTTFEGLVIEVRSQEIEGKTWCAFSFRHDPGAARMPADAPAPAESPADEATRLGQRTAAWVYALPDFKTSMLRKGSAELITDAPPPAAPPAPPAPGGEVPPEAGMSPLLAPPAASPVGPGL